MKKKLAPLLACSAAPGLTVCGGGNKAAETMAASRTTTVAAAEAAKEKSRDDATETAAAEAAGEGMDALIEAAKAEGELTVYGSYEEEYLSAARQDFEKLYGIKVKYQRFSMSEVYTKMPGETGKPSTDVWFDGTTDSYNEAVADGLLMKHDAINTKNLTGDRYKNPANCWCGIYRDILGFIVNTGELDRLGLETPKTQDDLIEEEHKGLITLSSPNMTGTAKLFISTTVRVGGHDEAMEYFKALNKNISQYTKPGSGPSKMVDPDECVISIGFLHNGIYQILRGYDNTQLIVPEDGTSLKVGATAIFNGCVHPNTAKLWIEYAPSPDCADHAKENGSHQFLVPSNATQPEEATKFGLDMNNTTDYDLEDAKEGSAKHAGDFFTALGSSSDDVDSSRLSTE